MFKKMLSWFYPAPLYKIDIFKNAKGKFEFHHTATNGQIHAQSSQGYESKQALLDTVNKYYSGAAIRDNTK